MSRIVLRAAVVLLVLGGFAGAPLSAEDAPKTAEAFREGLADVEKALRSGKGRKGLRALEELIAHHGQQAHVTSRRTELVDLVRRLAFAAKFPAPDPDDLASGDIRIYNQRTGRISARYKPGQMADWEYQRGLYLFPAPAAGRLTVTIKGKRYPEDAKDSFLFLFGNTEHPKTGRKQLYELYFGSPLRETATHQYWLNPKFIHHDGDEKIEREVLDHCPIRSRGNFDLEVKITATRLTAKANRKKVAEIRKHKEVWGVFGFRGKDFDEIRIDGEIEPSWMQGKIDAIAEQNRDAFEQDFDPANHLPAWLLEAKGSGTDRPMLPFFPAGMTAAQEKVFNRYLALDEMMGHMPGLAALEKAGLSKGAAHYLLARAQLVRHDLEEARKSVTRARAFTMEFHRAQLLEGIILTLANRQAEGDKLMAPVIKAYQPDELLYTRLAAGLMRSGRADAARRISVLASAHGVRSENLQMLERALLKAVRGPDWRRVYEVKSKTYHVVTDIDKKTAREASKVLEDMYRTYQSTLQKIPDEDGRLFKVYLFSGQAGFLGYLGDLRMFWGGGGKRAAGVYSPLLKQLLIWNLPSRDEMLETVRHEGFHQFFDRYLPHAPVWFNEGLAEYFERSARRAGKVRTGLIAYDNVRLLKKGAVLPVGELFATTGRTFYAKAPATYATSWLLVHMLRDGSEKRQALYRRFMTALEEGDAETAMETVFPPSSHAELDRAMKRYLDGLPDGR